MLGKFTPNEVILVSLVQGICGAIGAVISLLFCVYIILLHFFSSEAKNWLFKRQTIRLLFLLEFSCFLSNVGDVLAIITSRYDYVDGLCIVQGAMCCIYCYSLMISLLLMLSIAAPTISRRSRITLELVMHGVVLCWVLLILLLPFVGNTYGRSATWCWISFNTAMGRIWALSTAYIPAWIAMAVASLSFVFTICFVAVYVYRRSNKEEPEFSIYRMNNNELAMNTYLKLAAYPAIMIIVWILPTANRILHSVGHYYLWLTVSHKAIQQTQGVFNVVVYMVNPFAIYHNFVYCFKLIKRKTRRILGIEFEPEQKQIIVGEAYFIRGEEGDNFVPPEQQLNGPDFYYKIIST